MMPWKWFKKLKIWLKVFWFQPELRVLDLEEFIFGFVFHWILLIALFQCA